jgi:hypothetical protein
MPNAGRFRFGYASGEAVADMIVSDMLGKTWSLPHWLPKHYLTTSLKSEGKVEG